MQLQKVRHDSVTKHISYNAFEFCFVLFCFNLSLAMPCNLQDLSSSTTD